MNIRMKSKIEFFYDCSSPWTYLAFVEVEKLVTRHKLDLIWKPILVGGIFNTVNPSVYETRANPVKAKQQYSNKDMKDWSDIRGIEINWPLIFPVNSVRAMRGAFYAIDKEKISFNKKLFDNNINNSIKIIGDPKNRGSIISFTIKGIHPHDIATILDEDGVAIRAGHHCCQIFHEKMNLTATARASIGVYNTKDDIDILCKAIENCRKVFDLK
mgnify:CR=1 FL=1